MCEVDAIPLPIHYNNPMSLLPPSLQEKLHKQRTHDAAHGVRRVVHPVQTDGVWVLQDGQRYLSFCSNDYLGIAATLAKHPATLGAYGAGASRMVTGSHPAYAELESTLAAMKGAEAAWVFGSGYLTSLGTIPALVGAGDLVLMDRLSHACMIDGVRLSGARFYRYQHNDLAHAEALLQKHRGAHRHCIILTETVFSMDGDRAPLAALAALAQKHDAWLMSDDAHGFGLPYAVPNPAHIQMGTLSKAAGAYGGYVVGEAALIDHLITHARTALFSTALPQALVESALAGLRIMRDEPKRGQRVMRHAQRVCEALGRGAPESVIIPIILGDNATVMQAQQTLRAEGILVSAIRPPTVPTGTARLRISLSAAHSNAEVERLVAALHRVLPIA
jgi:8-amino-7-oxononanoate synthase